MGSSVMAELNFLHLSPEVIRIISLILSIVVLILGILTTVSAAMGIAASLTAIVWLVIGILTIVAAIFGILAAIKRNKRHLFWYCILCGVCAVLSLIGLITAVLMGSWGGSVSNGVALFFWLCAGYFGYLLMVAA